MEGEEGGEEKGNGQLLLDRDRQMRREEGETGLPPDLMNVDPMKLTGLSIHEDLMGLVYVMELLLM